MATMKAGEEIAPGSDRPRPVGHPPRSEGRPRVEALPIGAYWAMLRRQRVIVAAAVGIGLMLGFAAVWSAPPTWQSGATVMLPSVPKDPAVTLGRPIRAQRAMTLDSETALMLSDPVLRRAVSGTTLTASELAERVTVIAVPNSRVLRVQVTELDRRASAQLSGNLAAAYLDARQQMLLQRRSQQSESLRRQIAALQAPGEVTERALAALRAESDDGKLAGEVGVALVGSIGIDTELRNLRYRLQQLESQQVVSGELIREASEPRKVRSRAQVLVISWLIGVLAVAGVSIAWRERRPRRARHGADAARLPFLDGVPVGVLRRTRHVHDSDVGWVRMVEAIGRRPRAVTVVPLTPELGDVGVDNLAEILRRRGLVTDRFVRLDHQAAGQIALVRGALAAGRHAICAGPPVEEFGSTLTATVTDQVVLVSHSWATTPDDLRRAMVEMSRLGLNVTGLIVDERKQRGITKRRLAKIPMPRSG